MKRQRGRGRKPGGGGGHSGGHGGHHHNNQPNRTLESNGPDMKVRGPAAHIYERYLQLARDATSAGDRVMGENYLQHAEHYFRMLRAMQPAAPPPQERFNNDQDYDDEEGAGQDGGENVETETAEGGDQPDVEFPGGQQQQHQQNQQGGERDADGNFRRRRGRRNRFRPDGEREAGDGAPREGGEREGGEPQRAEQRQDRGPRQPRERGEGERPNDQGGPEGFSSGPKPAFLGSD